MSVSGPLALNLDLPQQQSFIKFYNSMPEIQVCPFGQFLHLPFLVNIGKCPVESFRISSLGSGFRGVRIFFFLALGFQLLKVYLFSFP
ncbi:hypothetical protein JTB14_030674 [Gonioctena quinquepunctata]|nr:hypothetical protein JTB14_030674 [Gonioctena quinquepunctata]